MVKVGVLALQGDFREHMKILEKIGAFPFEVRLKRELEKAEAIVVPGGESTTILTLMKENNLFDGVRNLCLEGMPCFGTCAGIILLSKESPGIENTLGLVNIRVRRNAYGRQRESFEEDIELSWSGEPFRGVFIRAPRIEKVWGDVQVLGRIKDEPVLVRQGNVIGATFHPELTEDTRVHKYFLTEVRGDA